MPTVQNSRSGDVIVEGVQLKPGSNEITDEQAATLRESAAFKRHARRGWLSGLDPAAAAPAPVAVTVQTPPTGPAAPSTASTKRDDDVTDASDRARSRPPGSRR